MREQLVNKLTELTKEEEKMGFRYLGNDEMDDWVCFEFRKVFIAEDKYVMIAGEGISPIAHKLTWRNNEQIVDLFEQAIQEKGFELHQLEIDEEQKDEEFVIHTIAINGSVKDVETYNKQYGLDLKSTDWHFGKVVEKIVSTIQKVGNNGGWYMGEGIRVETRVLYEPESK